MSGILVAGLINIETTLRVEGFPIVYEPVRYPFYGVSSSVSGVGYNVAKALGALGEDVRLAAMIGRDDAGQLVYRRLRADGIAAGFVIDELEQTPQSVILYDAEGRRQINVDLKDIQDRGYPPALFEQAAQGCPCAVLCNINFARPFLDVMQARGVPIATDVHAIADLDDDYNRDYMRAAQILFMSDERLPCPPEDWVRRVWERYKAEIVVVGLGAQGALLGVRSADCLERLPAVQTRPIVSTIGAGDALFACFVALYHRTGDPYLALRKAMVFASYKIDVASAAEGFLDTAALDELYAQVAGG